MSIAIYRVLEDGRSFEVGFAADSIGAAYVITGFNSELNRSAEAMSAHAECDKVGKFYYYKDMSLMLFNSSQEALLEEVAQVYAVKNGGSRGN